jgi:hypothetical protein
MTTLAKGSIVKSARLHAVPFGTVDDVRPQHHQGRGWGEVEYLVRHHVRTWRASSWIDENYVEPATLDDVLTYYADAQLAYIDRIKKLRNMIGQRLPKFNPEKHLGSLADGLCDAFRHEDGSLTYVFRDPEPGDTDSPRTYDGNVATLIQESSRHIDLDDDVAGLREAHERWTWPGHPGTGMVKRYIAMFRPDILHYEDHWSVGQDGSYGWGYVTKENWEAAMGTDPSPVTPEEAFDQEVKIFGLWAEGEVYGSCHIAKRGDEPDTVHGHLGYDDGEAIATYHTDSPILEVFA